MPKVGMQPIRRQQLIRATVDVIRDHGFDDATIARISRKAGLSTGIISHYFGGKNELLAASMRWLLRELQTETSIRLRRASTPRERLDAVINASFDSDQFKPGVPQVWLAFYAQIPHEPQLARLHRVYMRRLRSNLRHAFRALMPADDSSDAAEGVASMIDGLYVRAALTDQALDTGLALRLMREYVDFLITRRGSQAAPVDTGTQPDASS